MSNKSITWDEVHSKLTTWCGWAINNGVMKECNCPNHDELRNSPPEALNRLYKALKAGAYHGDWKRYLEAQNGK